MNLNHVLSTNELKQLFHERTATCLSQHDKNRHYEISYNDDLTFVTTTFHSSKAIGVSHGSYDFIEDDGGTKINIRYHHVFHSPHPTSPFHPENPFYPKLENYVIGPFYTINLNHKLDFITILYNHLQTEKEFKILNLYLNEPQCP